MQHQVPVEDGITLDVRIERPEKATRRMLLVLPGTLVTHASMSCPLVTGADEDAMQMMARQEWIALCPTYAGYGASTRPVDGKSVTWSALCAHMTALIRWACRTFEVERLDVVGSSLGALLALELAAVDSPVKDAMGRLVLTSLVYKDVSPVLRESMLSGAMREALLAAPNGYLQTAPADYRSLLGKCGLDVVGWAHRTLPGRYAVGPTLVGFDLPVCEAKRVHKPAMLVWGDKDPLTPWGDVQIFQSEYGGPLMLRVVKGGGHAPFWEPQRQSLWQGALAFLDPLRTPLDDEPTHVDA